MGGDKIAPVFILVLVSLLPIEANSVKESTNNNTNGDFFSKVVSTLVQFCPHQDLAQIDSNTGRTDNGSCCTEFFNSNDTSSVTNPDLVYAAKPFQKCLFVQSHEPTMYTAAISYYVVVDAPPGGCLTQVTDHGSQTEEEETLFEPRCDDDMSPWKRLFPVFSKTTALIYKTPNCAFCHGVRDLFYWLPKVICEEVPSFTSSMDSCDIFFYYSGNHDDVKHLQCYKSYFGTCPSDGDDELPPDIGLTKNELKQACHINALPPFTNLVLSKNVFCYICNYHNTGGYLPIQSCDMYTSESDQNRFGALAFIGIIDIFSLRDLDDVAPTTEDSADCSISFNYGTECQVMCPLGQTWVRRNKERVCAFELLQWTGSRFKALLVLTSDQRITIDGTDLEIVLTERLLRSPWPRRWKISSLNRRVAESPENTTLPENPDNINEQVSTEATAINQLLVELIYMKTSINPKEVLQEVDTAMKKTWTLNFNRARIIFKQRMSRYTLKEVTFPNNTDTERKFTVPMWHRMRYDAPIRVGPMPIFEHVRQSGIQSHSLNYINNLFFCSQVELPAAYFTVFRYDQFFLTALYNTTTGYLFDNEFDHFKRSSGESYFRICVNSLIARETSASVNPSSYSLTFKLSLMYLTFTVITNFWLHN